MRRSVSLVGLVALAACGRAPPPCVAGAVCTADATCLDGTCPPMTAMPGRSARRLALRPVAVAWVRRGSSERESICTLGGLRDTKLLLRFSVPIEEPERIVSAHVLLSRVFREPPLSQGEGEGAVLYATRIVDPWEEASVTWATQPRTFDVGLPRVRAYGSRVDRLRIDVKEVVKRWPRRDPSDQGVAIVGDGSPGVDVALTQLARDQVLGAAPVAGPELELYVSAGGEDAGVQPP